jgi:hypothetical protein
MSSMIAERIFDSVLSYMVEINENGLFGEI